uniref:SET domain-containing protein n=1 Tax=Plectus sambesii TaxID=2011161 RepID=A0A914XSA2_9BILA
MSLRSWWTNYRWRFAPWIAGRVAKDKAIRRSTAGDEDPQFRAHLTQELLSLCGELHRALPVSRTSERRIDRDEFSRAQEALRGTLGFGLGRSASTVKDCGEGVFVSDGAVRKDQLTAIYPGTVYFAGEPALLVSLNNSFIFRCADGCLIDGNDRRLSKFIYRSCCYRDRRGPFLTADMTWLTDRPANPLAIGQYVNNESAENPANVRYVELELETKSVHPTLRRFVPNVRYQSLSADSVLRLVVLVARRDVSVGEELFSSYFTIVE